MASLTVAEYERIEQAAMAQTPNRVIEAFQPVTFLQLGYPVRIRSEAELFKYIDVMQETRFENDYSNFIGGLTAKEFELVQKLTSLVCKFSEERFQRQAIARSSLVRMINVLRHIQYLFGSAQPRVFEIGPGCGYLGAMLMLLGYPYAATDVTQAFYLYQNHLLDFISNGQAWEGAEKTISPAMLGNIPPGSAAHIPWWDFVQMRPESVPQFDIVTCNHALCEMHPDSLRFTLKIARALLEGQAGPKAFIFEGWGWKSALPNKVGSVAEATDLLYRFGFSLVHNDSKITVFAPTGTENSVNCFPWEQLSASYVPNYFTAANNPLAQAILLGRQEHQAVEKIGLEPVNNFYTNLLGSEDHLTPDEHFLKLLGRRY